MGRVDGRGRPPRLKDRPSERVVSFRLDDRGLEALVKMAQRKGQTRAEFVRSLIAAEAQRHPEWLR